MVDMGRVLGVAFGLVGWGCLLVAALGGCSTTSAVGGAADGSAEAAAVVADAPQGDAPIACTAGYDCSSLFFSEPSSGSSVPCCTDKVCRLEPYDDCTDATAQLIQASSYDQSCTTDRDCVAVAEGNFCYPGAGDCANAAINMSAYAQYQADVSKTRAASCFAPSGCGFEFGPCCVGGKCQMGSQCPGAVPTDAGADTGADACAPSGCNTACPAGTRDVSSLVGGCIVWQCCVPDGAGADAGTDGSADASGE